MRDDDYFDPFDRRATITFAGVVVASCAFFVLAAGIYKLLGGMLWWSLQLLQRGTIARGLTMALLPRQPWAVRGFAGAHRCAATHFGAGNRH
jgi:CubicO group peptidase (beta-lactamase class C family)